MPSNTGGGVAAEAPALCIMTPRRREGGGRVSPRRRAQRPLQGGRLPTRSQAGEGNRASGAAASRRYEGVNSWFWPGDRGRRGLNPLPELPRASSRPRVPWQRGWLTTSRLVSVRNIGSSAGRQFRRVVPGGLGQGVDTLTRMLPRVIKRASGRGSVRRPPGEGPPTLLRFSRAPVAIVNTLSGRSDRISFYFTRASR